MPKNEVNDLITDQEMAFALLVYSGTMSDQRAAEAVGLNPNTAAYVKSKPCVLAFMLEHRAAVQQQLVEQESEGLRPGNVARERVLDRLWELARLGPEITRGSITGQVKAMSMIVAIEGLIPDRRAGSADKNPAPPPPKLNIYVSKWRREQLAKENGSQPNPGQEEAQEEDGIPIDPAEPAFGSAEDAPPDPSPIPSPDAIFDLSEPPFATPVSFLETQSAPYAAFAPDTRVPFSIKKGLFSRRRL
jgi:hypothetical protein